MAWVLFAILAAGGAYAEDVQWVRVTVLLEGGPQKGLQTSDSLIPGGIYSFAEIERRGIEAIDADILERVRFLAGEMRDVEQSMRLTNMLSRQYYLPLRVGEQAVVPVIDLNPRLGVVLEPQQFEDDRVVCRVQFLEPEGPQGAIEYTGEPISLMLKEVDIKDVIRTFSVVTRREIIVDEAVSGQVTVDLRNMPWDQAFDVVLRTNNLGWEAVDGALRVTPLDELSRRRKVRTEATINLPRGGDGAATIASRGDSEHRTVVLVIESVAGEPDLVVERDGLLHPPNFRIHGQLPEESKQDMGNLLVFRGTATEEGDLRDVEILASPFPRDDMLKVLRQVKPWTVLDEQVRRIEAVVAFGRRIIAADDGFSYKLEPIDAVERIGVELEVGTPAVQDAKTYPDLYEVSVVLRDLATAKVISAPRIHVRKGEEGTVRATIRHPDGTSSAFEMRISVTEDGCNISYSWEITSNGEVVSSNTANFAM
jgi:hypothetical protein